MFAHLWKYFFLLSTMYLIPRSTCGKGFSDSARIMNILYSTEKKGPPFGITALEHTQPSEAKNLKAREHCSVKNYIFWRIVVLHCPSNLLVELPSVGQVHPGLTFHTGNYSSTLTAMYSTQLESLSTQSSPESNKI